jgi:hypothetical protein
MQMGVVTIIKSGSFAIISGVINDVISGIARQTKNHCSGSRIVGFDYNSDHKCLIMYKL